MTWFDIHLSMLLSFTDLESGKHLEVCAGRRRQNHIYTSISNQLEIRLVSSNIFSFLIKFESKSNCYWRTDNLKNSDDICSIPSVFFGHFSSEISKSLLDSRHLCWILIGIWNDSKDKRKVSLTEWNHVSAIWRKSGAANLISSVYFWTFFIRNIKVIVGLKTLMLNFDRHLKWFER